MANADIWMPLYIGDYLADTSRLTTEQHGAYMLLIMDYWRNGPPPNDPQVLAQITRMSADAWSNAQAMLATFFSIEAGVWRHNRIDAELAEAKENKVKAVAKAAAAAGARWSKQKVDAPSNAPSNAKSNPQEMLEQCPSPSPSPSPSSNKGQGQKIKPSAASPRFDPRATLREAGVDDQTANDWLVVRQKKGLPLTATAWAAVIREAEKCGMTTPDAVRLACERSWVGFDASWVLKDRNQRASPMSKQAALEARNAEAGRAAKKLIFGDEYAA